MMNKIYNILLYASITFLVVLLVLSIVDKAKADDPIYMKPMYGRENRGVSFMKQEEKEIIPVTVDKDGNITNVIKENENDE